MAEVKRVNARGEVTISKQHAGRTVCVDQLEEGVWIARVIPDHERWLHTLRNAVDRGAFRTE